MFRTNYNNKFYPLRFGSYGPAIAPSPIEVFPKFNTTFIDPLRSSEQIFLLTQHVKTGFNLIKQGKYAEATEHFTNKTMAEKLGIKLDINRIELDSYPKNFVEAEHSIEKNNKKSFYNPACNQCIKPKIKLQFCYLNKGASNQQERHINEYFTKEESLLALEEWLHSLQDAQGQPVSKAVRELTKKIGVKKRLTQADKPKTMLKFAKENGKQISTSEWIKVIKNTFGTKFNKESYNYAAKLEIARLNELDVAMFFIENQIPFEKNFLKQHNRNRLIN